MGGWFRVGWRSFAAHEYSQKKTNIMLTADPVSVQSPQVGKYLWFLWRIICGINVSFNCAAYEKTNQCWLPYDHRGAVGGFCGAAFGADGYLQQQGQ
jgi:hypothetical protein